MSGSTTATIDASPSSSFASANRGALITVFTPPISCLATTTLVSFSTTALSAPSSSFLTTKIFINHFSWGDSACYPSTIATVSGSTKWGNGYYYSPGICPSGWTTACQISTSAFGFSTSLASSQTAMMCCPSFYSCITTSTTFSFHGCITYLQPNQTLTSIYFAPTPTPNVAIDPNFAPKSIGNFTLDHSSSAVCDGIPILWQSSDLKILSLATAMDLSILTSSSSTTSSSEGLGSTSQSSSSFLPTNTSSPSPSSSTTLVPSTGISTQTKIGIGISIPIFFIAVIFGIFLFFRRRKGGRSIELDGNGIIERHEMETGFMVKLEMDGKGKVGELDSPGRFEVEGSHGAVEIADGVNGREDAPVFELAGDERGAGISN